MLTGHPVLTAGRMNTSWKSNSESEEHFSALHVVPERLPSYFAPAPCFRRAAYQAWSPALLVFFSTLSHPLLPCFTAQRKAQQCKFSLESLHESAQSSTGGKRKTLSEGEERFADAGCGILESVEPFFATARKLLFFLASDKLGDTSRAFYCSEGA